MKEEIKLKAPHQIHNESVEAHKKWKAIGVDKPIHQLFSEAFRSQVAEVSTALVDMANVSNDENSFAEGLAFAIGMAHRTIQADFIEKLVDALEIYSKQTSTDPRNEFAVEKVKRMVKAAKEL